MLSVLGTEELNLQLMRADWKITASEYILIRLGVMLVGFVLGWLIFGSLLSGLAMAILAPAVSGATNCLMDAEKENDAVCR